MFEETEYMPEKVSYILNVPTKLDHNTQVLVKDFAEQLAAKLYKSQEKYGYSDNWKSSEWMDECRDELNKHVLKGDPLDVAAYCAFLNYHKSPTFVIKQ